MVLFELFDKQIVPILLYGSEIWGTTECEVIEKVHKKFLKRVLGVSQNAPDAFIYGETGRCPLFRGGLGAEGPRVLVGPRGPTGSARFVGGRGGNLPLSGAYRPSPMFVMIPSCLK